MAEVKFPLPYAPGGYVSFLSSQLGVFFSHLLRLFLRIQQYTCSNWITGLSAEETTNCQQTEDVEDQIPASFSAASSISRL
jgi:hypothetical protein